MFMAYTPTGDNLEVDGTAGSHHGENILKPCLPLLLTKPGEPRRARRTADLLLASKVNTPHLTPNGERDNGRIEILLRRGESNLDLRRGRRERIPLNHVGLKSKDIRGTKTLKTVNFGQKIVKFWF